MKTKDEIKSDWYEFANNAFIEWRGPTRKGLTEFADWIGISQPVMSLQMKKGGSVPRDQKTITAWCKRYGVNKIYSVLDIPVTEISRDISPNELQALSEEIGATFQARGLSGGEPEAVDVVKEIIIKHGFNVTSTTENSVIFS